MTPTCYGSFEFIPVGYKGVPSYENLPWDSLLCVDEPVDAILMEYLHWESLSYRNITPDIAKNILATLKIMHSVGIVHGDIHGRHILLDKDNRITFV